MTRRFPFQKLLHRGVGEVAKPFPGNALLTLDLYHIMLGVKQGIIKYHFLAFSTTWDWTPVSRTIGEHSNHYANGPENTMLLLSSIAKGEDVWIELVRTRHSLIKNCRGDNTEITNLPEDRCEYNQKPSPSSSQKFLFRFIANVYIPESSCSSKITQVKKTVYWHIYLIYKVNINQTLTNNNQFTNGKSPADINIK